MKKIYIKPTAFSTELEEVESICCGSGTTRDWSVFAENFAEDGSIISIQYGGEIFYPGDAEFEAWKEYKRIDLAKNPISFSGIEVEDW